MSRIRFLQSFSFPLPINFSGIFAAPEKPHKKHLLDYLLNHLVVFLHTTIAEIGADDVGEEVQPEVVAD